MTNPFKVSPCFGTINFASATESLHTPILADAPPSVPSIGCDVFIAIDAPSFFAEVPGEAYIALFFDHSRQHLRELPSNAFQVHFPKTLSPLQFTDLATRAEQMLRYGFMHQGIVSLDVTDLRNVFSDCKNKRLALHIIDYDDLDDFPLARIEGLQFQSLFALLLADTDLRLDHYSAMVDALEGILRPDGLGWFGANFGDDFYAGGTPSLFLLGEVA
tara:strand:+ start:304 stop:954 length:651 start_codon:yes stop_codon:yes gene_type:complete